MILRVGPACQLDLRSADPWPARRPLSKPFPECEQQPSEGLDVFGIRAKPSPTPIRCIQNVSTPIALGTVADSGSQLTRSTRSPASCTSNIPRTECYITNLRASPPRISHREASCWPKHASGVPVCRGADDIEHYLRWRLQARV